MPELLTVDPPSARLTFRRRVFWALLATSLATLTVSLCASGGVLMLCSFGGWLVTALTLLIAVVRLVYCPAERNPAWFGLGLVVLLLIAHTKVASRTERLFGLMLDGRPVVTTSLKSLGDAIQQYVSTQGTYPESLTELVKADQGLVHPKNLISPLDPGCDYSYSYNDWPPGLIYSSYLYQPGKGPWVNDSRIVLAYQYAAWQPMEFRLFPEYGRFVLFGDMRVDLLDPMSFNRAMRDDAVRRRELVWPRKMSRPVGEPPITAASAPATGM